MRREKDVPGYARLLLDGDIAGANRLLNEQDAQKPPGTDASRIQEADLTRVSPTSLEGSSCVERPPRAVPFRPECRGSLPGLERVRAEEVALPGFPLSLDEPPEQILSELEQRPTVGCPSWLLNLYDAMGGEKMRQGRGASWSMRLFVGALLHLPIEKRDGEWHRLRFRTEEVIQWLHPQGWPHRARDWERFPQALERMKPLGWVSIPGWSPVAILFPSHIPTSPVDSDTEFTVRIPSRAAYGASLDWPTLCQYGKDSAVLYRAYLSVAAFQSRSARRGNAITREIGAPMWDEKGKPRRRKGGGLVRSRESLVDNPAAKYVKELSDRDLTRMIGLDPDDKRDRWKARKAFDRLHEDGVIDLQKEGRTCRIFAP